MARAFFMSKEPSFAIPIPVGYQLFDVVEQNPVVPLRDEYILWWQNSYLLRYSRDGGLTWEKMIMLNTQRQQSVLLFPGTVKRNAIAVEKPDELEAATATEDMFVEVFPAVAAPPST